MASLLSQLHDDEAILLMYLADELPAQDRQTIEQRLGDEPRLRQSMEALVSVQSDVTAMLSRADAASSLPVAVPVAVRHTSRLIRQWQVRKLTEPEPAAPERKGLRHPWWSYPLTAVASLLIAFLVWWGNTGGDLQSRTAMTPQQPMAEAPMIDPMVDTLARSLSSPDDTEFRDFTWAEREVASLSESDEVTPIVPVYIEDSVQ